MAYKLQSTHSKQNQKQILHESNKLCILQTESKKSLERLKNKSVNRPVSWDGLKIFLTNISPEYWYSYSLHNRGMLSYTWPTLVFFNALNRYKVSVFSDLSRFQGTPLGNCFRLIFMAANWNNKLFLLLTTSGTGSWQPFEAIFN